MAEDSGSQRRPSLLARLVLSQALALGTAYLVVVGWMIYALVEFGNGDLDKRLSYLAKTLAETASSARDDSVELSKRIAETERILIEGYATLGDSAGYVPVYQVWGRDGGLLARSEPAVDLPRTLTDGRFMRMEHGGYSWQTVSARSGDGQVMVQVAERWDQRLWSNWPMIRYIGVLQLIVFGWCTLIMWWMAKKGFQPLTDLAQQLAQRQPGTRTPVQARRLYAETAPIVDELNKLLGRQARSLDNERAFLADAAHELRTPLAAINAQAHLLLSAPDEATSAEAGAELRQGMDRISHLLVQLLAIARAETSELAAQREDTDLVALSQERLAALALLARPRSIELSMDAPVRLHCALDRAGFVSLFDNLVDNAIRYTSVGGQVVVSLAAQNVWIELRVSDDGPGIPLVERERVFNRFYRMPGSPEIGSGLGLSIVSKVAQSHGGTVHLEDGLDGRGLTVVVRLPLPVGPT